MITNQLVDHGTSPSGFHYLIAIIPDQNGNIQNRCDMAKYVIQINVVMNW